MLDALGAAGGVGADEHLAPDPPAPTRARQLPQRLLGHRAVVAGGVAPGGPPPPPAGPPLGSAA